MTNLSAVIFISGHIDLFRLILSRYINIIVGSRSQAIERAAQCVRKIIDSFLNIQTIRVFFFIRMVCTLNDIYNAGTHNIGRIAQIRGHNITGRIVALIFRVIIRFSEDLLRIFIRIDQSLITIRRIIVAIFQHDAVIICRGAVLNRLLKLIKICARLQIAVSNIDRILAFMRKVIRVGIAFLRSIISFRRSGKQCIIVQIFLTDQERVHIVVPGRSGVPCGFFHTGNGLIIWRSFVCFITHSDLKRKAHIVPCTNFAFAAFLIAHDAAHAGGLVWLNRGGALDRCRPFQSKQPFRIARIWKIIFALRTILVFLIRNLSLAGELFNTASYAAARGRADHNTSIPVAIRFIFRIHRHTGNLNGKLIRIRRISRNAFIFRRTLIIIVIRNRCIIYILIL